MATNSITFAAQLVSTACNVDERLDIRNLIPKTQEQKIALTARTLDDMTRILNSVRDLVLQHGTTQHKSEFCDLVELCRTHYTTMEQLEKVVKGQQRGWKAILLCWKRDNANNFRVELKELQEEVALAKDLVFRASGRFRADLLDSGLVAIIVQEDSQQPQSQQELQSSTHAGGTANEPQVSPNHENTKNPVLVVIENPFLNTTEHRCAGDPLGAYTSVSSCSG
ncbi:hypothetical protein C8R42DRAFT_780525 [Lentinula raphanica]|nr:hypothetical protein C8R42DRAFT_780525 [Lentinula raphanica]